MDLARGMTLHTRARPMSDSSLRNQAYERIRGKLVLGRLAAGSQISEPKLAKMLGIGERTLYRKIKEYDL